MDCTPLIENIKIKTEVDDSDVCCKDQIKDFFHYENNAGGKCEVKKGGKKNELYQNNRETRKNCCSKSAVDSGFSEISSIKKNFSARNKNHRLKTKPPVRSETSTSSSLISKNFGEGPSTSSTPYSLRAHKRKYTDENDIKEEKNTELELSIGTHPKNNDIKDSDLKETLNVYRDLPSYSNLNKFCHRQNPNAIVFTEDEARELVADCLEEFPKLADLPKEPGTKYLKQFIQVMPNLYSSDEEELEETAAKKIKKKAVGYNGKPLPDSCLLENYDWLYQDEEWIKKNRHPTLKTPIAKRLRSCVEAGEEITKEVVAELEKMADCQVSATTTTTVLSDHQVSTATTNIRLLPAD